MCAKVVAKTSQKTDPVSILTACSGTIDVESHMPGAVAEEPDFFLMFYLADGSAV